MDPLSSSRLCSCKPRLVDTLQLPLRLGLLLGNDAFDEAYDVLLNAVRGSHKPECSRALSSTVVVGSLLLTGFNLTILA